MQYSAIKGMTMTFSAYSQAMLAMWSPGPWEIVIIVLAILLLFGGKKLPELARGLGRGLREFKKELKGTKDDIKNAGDEDDKKPEDKSDE